MDKQANESHTLEHERQQLLQELAADHTSHWVEQFKPGSFGGHELLDRTALLADLVDRWIRTHPACVQQAAWFALADQATVALLTLYQQVGAAQLDVE